MERVECRPWRSPSSTPRRASRLMVVRAAPAVTSNPLSSCDGSYLEKPRRQLGKPSAAVGSSGASSEYDVRPTTW
jgi:hypothetical protein